MLSVDIAAPPGYDLQVSCGVVLPIIVEVFHMKRIALDVVDGGTFLILQKITLGEGGYV